MVLIFGFFTCSLGTVTIRTPFSMDSLTKSALAFSGAGTVSGTRRWSSPRGAMFQHQRLRSVLSGCLGSSPGFPFGNGNSSSDSNSLSVRRVWDPETSVFAGTHVDWKETPDAHIFTADLPGVKREEVKVEVEEGRILRISGQRSKEKEDKNETWHRNAKADLVLASMENGVLTVTIRKVEGKKPEVVKAIEISG
ncbi:unnamed protein product [Spirodela intermedia]|uniref:SHSP domain-containing protein n=1 Tax=Spirodela intermedia TaxID=51605 RepID=A0A7I8JS02_SPIIN|nr:unnamed protein product [Spirodela intermedia]CAA6672343.1 unnamed protein product [Spirodela intermedia]